MPAAAAATALAGGGARALQLAHIGALTRLTARAQFLLCLCSIPACLQLGDFGLSRMLGQDQSHVDTQVKKS